jgi:hypothetical protein
MNRRDRAIAQRLQVWPLLDLDLYPIPVDPQTRRPLVAWGEIDRLGHRPGVGEALGYNTLVFEWWDRWPLTGRCHPPGPCAREAAACTCTTAPIGSSAAAPARSAPPGREVRPWAGGLPADARLPAVGAAPDHGGPRLASGLLRPTGSDTRPPTARRAACSGSPTPTRSRRRWWPPPATPASRANGATANRPCATPAPSLGDTDDPATCATREQSAGPGR